MNQAQMKENKVVEFICKLDKEHNSLCQIRQGEIVIYLTEKELASLVREMYEKREDVFVDVIDKLAETDEGGEEE